MCMALLGERIRERRQELKLTQTELAQKTGLGQSSINRLENGDTPDPRASTLNALSAALGVSAEWLQGLDEAHPEEGSQEPPSSILSDLSPPTFGAIPGWADLERVARRKAPEIDGWVWDELRASNPLFAAKMQLSVSTVIRLAQIVSEHVPPPSVRNK